LSSISVVTNSLLLRTFRPRKRNYLSMVAPIIMILLFTYMFMIFARFSNTMGNMMEQLPPEMNHNIERSIETGETWMAFSPGGTPKLFFSADSLMNPMLIIHKGIFPPETDEMVLGADEAKMMISENPFQKPGDKIVNFFGIPTMRVTGILKPTGTILDMFYFITPETAENLLAPQLVKIQFS